MRHYTNRHSGKTLCEVKKVTSTDYMVTGNVLGSDNEAWCKDCIRLLSDNPDVAMSIESNKVLVTSMWLSRPVDMKVERV